MAIPQSGQAESPFLPFSVALLVSESVVCNDGRTDGSAP